MILKPKLGQRVRYPFKIGGRKYVQRGTITKVTKAYIAVNWDSGISFSRFDRPPDGLFLERRRA